MTIAHSYIVAFLEVYEWFIAGYVFLYMTLYLLFAFLSYYAIRKYVTKRFYINEEVLLKSNEALGVSVVAPAFNEAATIVYNVKSLLSLSYPKFEVVIVNDGSTDDTLEKLIKAFQLVKVDFYYQERIPTHTVRGHYKSKNQCIQSFWWWIKKMVNLRLMLQMRE